MARGGARPNAGRKAGAATKKTKEIADKAASEGITPLEFMLQIMRDPGAEQRDRMAMAVSAAPFVHARLSSVDAKLTGADGGPVDMSLNVSFVAPE